jgi:hypothetical protein
MIGKFNFLSCSDSVVFVAERSESMQVAQQERQDGLGDRVSKYC